MASEKELELQKKELELKERELALKEKELSQQGSNNQSTNETKSQNTDKNEAVIQNSDFSDVKIFWKFFKNAAISEDYKMLSEQTYFPFLNHGTYLYKKDFDLFPFPDYILAAIKKAKPPVKSSMAFGGGTDSNGNMVNVDFNYKTKCDLYEVNLGGPAIYFSKVEGQYKFIAILYGE